MSSISTGNIDAAATHLSKTILGETTILIPAMEMKSRRKNRRENNSQRICR